MSIAHCLPGHTCKTLACLSLAATSVWVTCGMLAAGLQRAVIILPLSRWYLCLYWVCYLGAFVWGFSCSHWILWPVSVEVWKWPIVLNTLPSLWADGWTVVVELCVFLIVMLSLGLWTAAVWIHRWQDVCTLLRACMVHKAWRVWVDHSAVV